MRSANVVFRARGAVGWARRSTTTSTVAGFVKKAVRAVLIGMAYLVLREKKAVECLGFRTR